MLSLEWDLFLCLFTSWSSGSTVLLADLLLDLLRDLDRDLERLSCRDFDFLDLALLSGLDFDFDLFLDLDLLDLLALCDFDLDLLLLLLLLRLRLLEFSLTSSIFLPLRS